MKFVDFYEENVLHESCSEENVTITTPTERNTFALNIDMPNRKDIFHYFIAPLDHWMNESSQIHLQWLKCVRVFVEIHTSNSGDYFSVIVFEWYWCVVIEFTTLGSGTVTKILSNRAYKYITYELAGWFDENAGCIRWTCIHCIKLHRHFM